MTVDEACALLSTNKVGLGVILGVHANTIYRWHEVPSLCARYVLILAKDRQRELQVNGLRASLGALLNVS